MRLSNGGNVSTQHIATFLGTTCCARSATLLQRVVTCWVLQIELVRMPWCNFVAGTWSNEYSIIQNPQLENSPRKILALIARASCVSIEF